MKKNSIFLLLFVILYSCQQKKPKSAEDSLTKKTVSAGINVNTATIKKTVFNKQLVSNAKIEAVQKSELRFKTNERLESVKVKNGQIVRKGQVLAHLENELLKNQLEKSKIDLQKAQNKLQEEKINYGLGKDTAEKDINPTILKTLKIKTGVFEAKNALENAQIRYSQTILKAPFSGVVANIESKEGFYISSAEVFCTVINPNKLEVLFSILENEFYFISKQQEITVQSFANKGKTYKGVITEINPLVDKNGLIKIKAKILTTSISLFDGMNVKVIINKPIKDVIVIPKEALVLRSNREVVFTVENGLAKWNYVERLDENSDSYAIKKGLKETDTVIVSGNLNLSHDAKINATFTGKLKVKN